MNERSFIVALAGSVWLAMPALASAAAVTNDSTGTNGELAELRETVARMQQRIDELEAAQGDTWMTGARAEEIRGLVADVLADADTRASLLQGTNLAGWDKGFYLASADGNFRLKVGGQLQIRFVMNNQDDSPVDDDRMGFEARRARLFFSGHVFDPSWTYDIQINANRSGGTFFLEDAGWIQKDLGGGWKIRVGQMKAPFMREEMLSSIRMLAVERTLINSAFSAGTVQGVQVSWENDQFRVYGSFHDGIGSANTMWSAEDTEFAFSARAEYLAAGSWGQFLDWSGFPDEEFGVLIGGAIDYSQGEFGTGSNLPPPDFNNAELENLGLTADVMIDFAGGSIGGAIVYRTIEADALGATLDQIGFFIRGGYFIADTWEIYGQYEWGDLDVPGLQELSVITVGVTKYWNKHNLKWQTDIGFGLDDVNSVTNPLTGNSIGFANDGAGWRTDSAGNDGQIVIRSQLQLVF